MSSERFRKGEFVKAAPKHENNNGRPSNLDRGIHSSDHLGMQALLYKCRSELAQIPNYLTRAIPTRRPKQSCERGWTSHPHDCQGEAPPGGDVRREGEGHQDLRSTANWRGYARATSISGAAIFVSLPGGSERHCPQGWDWLFLACGTRRARFRRRHSGQPLRREWTVCRRRPSR